MGYDSEIIKISKLTNGYEIEIYDPPPAEVKAEKKAASKGDIPSTSGIYTSPWRTMAFTTFDDVIEFLEEKGPDLQPRNFDEEYAKSFQKTVDSLTKDTGTEK